MKISFHGAAEGVTGSCHLLQVGTKKILIDCGLFQGSREVEEENANSFGFDPSEIDYLLLTHAHLDHCGRIPLLAKQGLYRRNHYDPGNSGISKGSDVGFGAFERRRGASKKPKVAANAQTKQAPRTFIFNRRCSICLDFFGRRASYNKIIEVAKGIRATFIDAGHILGSACVLLELEEEGNKRTVLFSGDLGSNGRAILRDPSKPHTLMWW